MMSRWYVNPVTVSAVVVMVSHYYQTECMMSRWSVNPVTVSAVVAMVSLL